MEAMSGGEAFMEGPYLFYTAQDWLIAIGYPLEGVYTPDSFQAHVNAALAHSGARDCFAIAPMLPGAMKPGCYEEDWYYALPADAPVPAKVARHVRKAAESLRVEAGQIFTPEHRRLWAEFMGRKELRPQIRELFARTNLVLRAPGTRVELLNAWDGNGKLAACLLMDTAPETFSSYLLGAHSRTHYAPHAADLLFAFMLEKAREDGKKYIHLGLGVNEGITRFKEKWGGTRMLPYFASSWEASVAQRSSVPADGLDAGASEASSEGPGRVGNVAGSTTATTDALLNYLFHGGNKRDVIPEQKPFAMIWEAEKNGKVSWLCGTAHTFCCSFAWSFDLLFKKAHTAIFEGPLTPADLAYVARAGRNPAPGTPVIGELLSETEIRRLEKVIRGPQGALPRFLNMEWKHPPDVRRILFNTAPWFVFFSLWHAFLERHGWASSVDLELWELAGERAITRVTMETMQDQVESLESIPMDRILAFLRDCGQWKERMNRNRAAYLRGDLDDMMGSSTEFPTRTERVISYRDDNFFEQMLPYMEAGGAAVFVGTAHLLNLRPMLAEHGFRLRHTPFGLVNTLRARVASGGRGRKDIGFFEC